MARLPTNLVRIGAVYKFRARVQQDLLEHHASKREIVQSLKTKDLAEVKCRLPLVQKRVNDESEQIWQAKFEAKLRLA